MPELRTRRMPALAQDYGMNEPGRLHDLDDEGKAAWREAVATCLRAAIPEEGNPYLLAAPSTRTPYSTGPDWNGLPARVVSCRTRARVRRGDDRPAEPAQRRAQRDLFHVEPEQRSRLARDDRRRGRYAVRS